MDRREGGREGGGRKGTQKGKEGKREGLSASETPRFPPFGALRHTNSFCHRNVNCKAIIPLRSLGGENLSELGSKRKPPPGMQRPLFCGSLIHLPDTSVTLSFLKVLITHRRDYPGLCRAEMTQSTPQPDFPPSPAGRARWAPRPPDIAHAQAEVTVPP